MRSLMLTLVVGLFFSPAANASLVHYSAFGTFDASVPVTSVGGFGYTAPSQTWSFAFDIDENPLVDSSGGAFDAPFLNWAYLLSGSDTGLTPTDIQFFCICSGGMFEIDFDDLNFIGFT